MKRVNEWLVRCLRASPVRDPVLLYIAVPLAFVLTNLYVAWLSWRLHRIEKRIKRLTGSAEPW